MLHFALELYKIGAIQFGSYTLKSGAQSPIYLDLRLIISHPTLLKQVCETLWKKIAHLHFDLLLGVPYTALPISSYLSIEQKIPMILKRKEKKTYGTKKLIEGAYSRGQTCLVIEDIISSGSSVLETVEPVKETGVIVEDIAVIIDREQGGRNRLEENGFRVHSLFTLTEILDSLYKEQKIDQKNRDIIYDYLQKNNLAAPL